MREQRDFFSSLTSYLLHIHPEGRLLLCTALLLLLCGQFPILFFIRALLMCSSTVRDQECPLLCILANAYLWVIASLTWVKGYLTNVKSVWEAGSLSISLATQGSILWKLVASALAVPGGQLHPLCKRRIPSW